MRVKNVSNNTVFVDDLDLHIICDGNSIELSEDTLLKSRGLRSLIYNGQLKIVKYDLNVQIEKSIVFAMKEVGMAVVEEPEPIQSVSSGCEIEVKINGIFYEAGGYAKVNRYLAKNLVQKGVKVQIAPKKGQNQLNRDELEDIACLERTTIGRDYIGIDSIIPSFSESSSAKYKVLYTTVEAYSLPTQFIDCCKQYHEVWVTSNHGYQILRKYIQNIPIYIVPTGVDPIIYNEDVEPVVFNPKLKDFVFLSVFGWSWRKGYDLLLKAYFEAFSNQDPVSLLMFSRYMQGIKPAHQQKIQQDIDKIIGKRDKNKLPHYKVSSKIAPENMMPQIYSSCDAFVLASRGEGTNLPVCEASLCGLPVISTNVSGQRIYLKHDNSYLIEKDRLANLATGLCHVNFWDAQIMPSLSSQKCVDDLSEHMRFVFENLEQAKQKNKRLQDLLLKKFNWMDAAELAFERLKKIKEKK